jgi:sulfoxide reductase heme-binding subunit YedZ
LIDAASVAADRAAGSGIGRTQSVIAWQRIAKPLLFVVCAVPFLRLAYHAFTDALGANPVEAITLETGQWALRMLLVTLAITPLRKLSGANALVRVRRMLGLFAYFYACLHLLTYVWLDAFFSLAYIWDDIAKRLYITVGFTAFCLLTPLAATSTNAMIRRLGARRWQRLHRLAYLAAFAAILHFLWLVKADLREPLLYLAIFAVLMFARIPPVSRRLARLRPAAAAR